MDSSSILPPTNNHHPPPTNNYPSYADMIYRAIEALKEENGSTKSAISKYIQQVYNHHLPPESTHSTLLTHHLNQLKDNGLLHMVNDSYILPTSLPPPPSSSLAVQPSRPRGRPRKLQAQPQARGSVVEQPNAEPVSAALGLSHEPQDVAVAATVEDVGLESKSKGPGFLTKTVVDSGVGSEGMVSPRRRGRPPGSKNKKKPCRLVTAETSEAATAVAETSEDAAAVAVASSGTKRRPGRPPKKQKAASIQFDPAAEAPVAMDGDGDDGSVVAKSNAGASAAPVGGGGAGSGSARGRGGAMAVQHRSSFGKPVGSPKKGITSASASQNVADVQDLKRILKYFQSKVMESLEVLKPHFTHESPVSAISAIQELEVVGAMDLDALPKDETLPQQPPPPQQQQLPQKFQQLPQQQQQHQHQPPQFRPAPQQQIYRHQFPLFQQPYQPLQQFQPQLPHHRTFYP